MTTIQQNTVNRFTGIFFGDQGEALEMQLPVDTGTQKVLDQLIAHNLNPLIVGGAVRDAIRGKSPKDFDIEVHGAQSFNELREILKGLGPINLAGRDFGVMKLRVRFEDGSMSEEIDLSLPRRDSKTGDGHRGFTVDVDPTMSLREATARRDLTVNALVWDPKTSLVIDLHGGLKDMEDGVLRHVSTAFSEDPLRVLRVARFAAKMGFTVAPETVEISRSLKPAFNELATERIVGEMSRMIFEPFISKGFEFLKASGWNDSLGVPEDVVEAISESLESHAEKSLTTSENFDHRAFKIAIIASWLPSEVNARETLQNFATSKSELKRALAIVEAPAITKMSNSEARQWAWDNQSITAEEKIALDFTVGFADSETTAENFLQFESLRVIHGPEKDTFDANALIQAHKDANPGLKTGPWIKSMLQDARSAQYAR